MKTEKARWSQTKTTELEIEYARIREGKDLYVVKVAGTQDVSSGPTGCESKTHSAAATKQCIVDQKGLQTALDTAVLYRTGLGIQAMTSEIRELIRTLGVTGTYRMLDKQEGLRSKHPLTMPDQECVYDDFVAGEWGWDNLLRIYEHVAYDPDARPVDQAFLLERGRRFDIDRVEGRDALLSHLAARSDISFVDTRDGLGAVRGEVEDKYLAPIWRPGLETITEIFESGLPAGWQEGQMRGVWPDNLTFMGYFWSQTIERDLLGVRAAGINNENEASTTPGMGGR